MNKFYFNPIKKRIKTTEELQVYLQQALDTNATSWAQASRSLAKLVGDSNLSSLEVRTVSEGGSFPDRFVNKISTWTTGVPSGTKIQEVLDVVTALDKSLKDDYNNEVDRYSGLWKADKTSDKMVSLLVGDKYVTKPTTNNYTAEELAAVIKAKEAELAKKEGK